MEDREYLLADALAMGNDRLAPDEFQALQCRAIEASKKDRANWRLEMTTAEPVQGASQQVLTAKGMAFVARYIILSIEDPCPN